MIVYFEAKQPTRVAEKIFSQLTFPRVEFTGTENRVYLVEQNKTGAKSFRGYHSQFTLNSRPSTQYECSVKYMYSACGNERFHVEVKSMHGSTILKCVVARVYYFMLETLTCTLLPDHQYWQVTHVGWEAIKKALNILRQIENVSLIPVDLRHCLR